MSNKNKKVEKGDIFICDVCGEEFEAEWSHKEASDEFKETFGIPNDVINYLTCCDDCYKLMGGAND